MCPEGYTCIGTAQQKTGSSTEKLAQEPDADKNDGGDRYQQRNEKQGDKGDDQAVGKQKHIDRIITCTCK